MRTAGPICLIATLMYSVFVLPLVHGNPLGKAKRTIPAACTAWRSDAFIIRVDAVSDGSTLGWLSAVPNPSVQTLQGPILDRNSAGCFAAALGTTSPPLLNLVAHQSTGADQYVVVYSEINSADWTPSNPGPYTGGDIYIQPFNINDPNRGEEGNAWSLYQSGGSLALGVQWLSGGTYYSPKLYYANLPGSENIVANYVNPFNIPEVTLVIES